MPHIFRSLVQVVQLGGDTCVLVTGRSDDGHWGAEVRREIGNLMPIVFAAGGPKCDALLAWLRANGRSEREHVIWCDDNPWAIGPAP